MKEKLKKITINIPAIYIALKKKETPLAAKVMAFAVIAYSLSPIDLIPDFIPVIGYLDDILLLPILIALTVKLIPNDLFVQCKTEAQAIWADKKPKSWYYAIPIILFWLFIFIFTLYKCFS